MLTHLVALVSSPGGGGKRAHRPEDLAGHLYLRVKPPIRP